MGSKAGKTKRGHSEDELAKRIVGLLVPLIAHEVGREVMRVFEQTTRSASVERERCAALVEAASGDFSADVCRELARRIRA